MNIFASALAVPLLTVLTILFWEWGLRDLLLERPGDNQLIPYLRDPFAASLLAVLALAIGSAIAGYRLRRLRNLQLILESLKNAPEIIMITDRQFRIRYLNRIPPELARLDAVTYMNLRSSGRQGFWDGLEALAGRDIVGEIQHKFKANGSWDGILELNKLGFRDHWIEGSFRSIFSQSGRQIGMYVGLQDISKAKVLELRRDTLEQEMSSVAKHLPGFFYR